MTDKSQEKWTMVVKNGRSKHLEGMMVSGPNQIVQSDQREKKKPIASNENEQLKSWTKQIGVEPEKELKDVVKTTRILPKFDEMEDSTCDRIVVSPTHFNKKKFSGFVSFDEAQIICDAIGLEDHHGTTFLRDDQDDLLITFKLGKKICRKEIVQKIHKYFWYEKSSKEGFLNTISGIVIYPEMPDEPRSDHENVDSKPVETQTVQIDDGVRELRIDWCNYELTENQICNWVSLYGKIKGEIEEEAIEVPTPRGNQEIGTGVYLIKAKLSRKIPNLLPAFGKLIKVTYQGVKRQCKECYGYHREQRDCKGKKSYQEFSDEFTKDNPRIPQELINLNAEKKQEEETGNIKEEPEQGVEQDEVTENERDTEMDCHTGDEDCVEKDQITEEDIVNEFELCAPTDIELDWIKGQHSIGKEMMETMIKIIKNRRSGSGLGGSRQ